MFGMEEQENPQLDNQLANFADDVLNGEAHSSTADADSELRLMQETVILLKQALVNESSEPEVAERIRRQLEKEWKKRLPDSSANKDQTAWNLQQWLRHTFRGYVPARRFTWGFALAAVVAITVLALFDWIPGTHLTGTVLDSVGWLPILIPLLFLVIIAFVWWRRSRH